MRLLETASYGVQTFGSAGEFIDALAHGVPECALIDLQMPNMTGLQLQQYLAGAGIFIPTIIITANDESGSKERCMALGATAYMIKPLRKTELLAAIDSAMTMSR